MSHDHSELPLLLHDPDQLAGLTMCHLNLNTDAQTPSDAVVTLLGNKVAADGLVKTKSHWDRVALIQ